MGLRANPVVTCRQLLTLALLPLSLLLGAIAPALSFQDAQHITAILGESVVFNCNVDFPEDHPVPYVLQWEKKVGGTGEDIPVYIWYENYPTHAAEEYKGRVSGVNPESSYGQASLNLTNIRETDQGWYECKVVFLNRAPNQNKNGTWFHLDVHAPPRFSVTPEDVIYVNLGDAIILNCQAEGTPAPEILWYRDANPVDISATIGIFNDGTELRISNIRHEDIGDYTCIARNGEGQISHTARVIIAGKGYSGGPDYKQDYTIWYREANVANWSQIPVTPPGSTQVTINHLTPGTKYEFQVIGKNALGDGMLSKVIEVRTLGTKPAGAKPPDVVRPNPNPSEKSEKDFEHSPDDAAGGLQPGSERRERRLTGRSERREKFVEVARSRSGMRTLQKDVLDFSVVVFPTDSAGLPVIPPILRPRGPKPGPPRNLTVTEYPNGFLISWQTPLEKANLVQYYTIKYRTDAQWKTLNKQQIRSEETSFLVKNLVGGRTYHFRVLANSVSSYEASDEVKFPVPARVKHKAITAGVVGGILFFIVAIILSVCAVKICNKRKRRKQEKAYNMVACRITDSRNGGQPPGVSQVPLKKHRQGRVPGVTTLVDAGRWLLGALGLGLGLGSSRASSVVGGVGLGDVDEVDGPGPGLVHSHSLARIHRAPDGRFVLGASNRSSVSSSSDDGGFLSRGRAVLAVASSAGRASWRRPLVRCPSNLSVRSDGSGESGVQGGGRQSRHVTITTAIVHPVHAHHHYANQRTLARALVPSLAPSLAPSLPTVAAIYTPSRRTPHVAASSPTDAVPSAALSPVVPWSPALNFSDLSSVRTPPSAGGPSYQQLRSVHERYAQELPSLTAIHEQQQQLMLLQQQRPRPRPRPQPQPQPQPRHVFLPIPALSPSPRSPPRIRIPHAATSPWVEDPPSRATTATLSPWTTPNAHPAPAPPHRSRLPPRHVRHARSAPELSVRSRPSPNASAASGVETSPESRSSSSGFGSKNTSSQPNQSLSTPPYRPPPAPPQTALPSASTSTSRQGLGLGLQDWLGITAGLPQRPSPSPYQDKQGCDVSVDGHYEFDAVFVGTPTRDERGLSDSETTFHAAQDEAASQSSDSFSRGRERVKHVNIEARVQAMKEEFAAFRQRQARRRRSPQLESVC
ncbi:protein turtle [Frankliniella occidentalis]|uniref:Protein turtle n=1 Tax=Frankliniella occidentalis TaxID=133901 RepID=A0A9C6U5F4_FRAOC|nr:protein turtle [Frankliniella occidentalis]